MTPRNRLLLLVAAVVVLVVAFVVAQGAGDDDQSGGSGAEVTQTATPTLTTDPADPATTNAQEGTSTSTATTPAEAPQPKPKPAVPVVRVVDGEPKGGVKRLSFQKGDKIRFRVVSDVADEIHVHGYDEHFDVAAGGSATVALDATIEGRFEVELEDRGVEIVQLEVTP